MYIERVISAAMQSYIIFFHLGREKYDGGLFIYLWRGVGCDWGLIQIPRVKIRIAFFTISKNLLGVF